MKQYPKYKDSKISWIGDVPEHWETSRLKAMLKNQLQYGANSSGVEYDETLPRYIRITDITKDNCLTNTDMRSLSQNEAKEYILDDKDILFARSGATAGKAFLYKSGYGVAAFAGYLIRAQIKQNIMLAEYAYYSTLSWGYEQWRASIFIQATIPNIGANKYNNYILPVPPYSEQQAIVEFLDTAVDKIDRYIAAKEAEIEKLGTLKQSVISQAVTKGLNPAAPMKDSGIDWMGNIPENWEIHSIKQHFCIQKRIAGKEGYNVFSITQNGLKVKDISLNDGQMAANYSGYQFVHPGDFAMNHMDLITGGVGLSTAFGVTSPDYRVFELFDNNNCYSEYYLRVFQICYWRRIFYRHGRGAASTGRWRLPAKAFLNFQIPVPSIKEQKEIVKYINEQIEKIDTSISNIRQQIAKLKVYKQRLISDAVTGKIDVRITERMV